jgi:hypothetical protein
MRKKNQCLTLFLALKCILILMSGCGQNYDKDLVSVKSDGLSYLTTLGCLVDAPWEAQDSFFNVKTFLNGKEISSSGAAYDRLQKDLVFELHKNGSLTYWRKSENNITDSSEDKDGITRTLTQTTENDKLIKKYDVGFWKVDYNDSMIIINFANKDISNSTLKFKELGSMYGVFEQTYLTDSLIDGKKVKITKINTYYFQHPLHRF